MIGCGLSLGRADRLGQPRLSEGAQPYPMQLGPHAVLTLPRSRTDAMSSHPYPIHPRHLHPNLNTRTRYPMAETWDLRMILWPRQLSGLRSPFNFTACLEVGT